MEKPVRKVKLASMHLPITITFTERINSHASLQLCAGYPVKTEAPVWACRCAPVLTGLLDLNVRPVSSHFNLFLHIF